MISFTRVETTEIDERQIFDSVAESLFDEEVELSNFSFKVLRDLPEDVQRVIFAKIGAMLIDYAKSEDF